MANVTSVKGTWTSLTATPYTSGTVLISGVNCAADLVAVVIPTETGYAGTYTFKAGDFQNTSDVTVTGIANGTVLAITGLDGSKIDQDTGVLELYTNASGNLYLFARK